MYEHDMFTPVALAGLGVAGLNLSNLILGVATVIALGIMAIRYTPRMVGLLGRRRVLPERPDVWVHVHAGGTAAAAGPRDGGG